LEYLEDIPEAGVSVKIGEVPIEIVQTQDRAVKVARVGAVSAGASDTSGPQA